MDTVYKAPDGRTQTVMEFEKVKAQILAKLGWKPVPQPAVEPMQEPEAPQDDRSEQLDSPAIGITWIGEPGPEIITRPGRKAKK